MISKLILCIFKNRTGKPSRLTFLAPGGDNVDRIEPLTTGSRGKGLPGAGMPPSVKAVQSQ